MSRLVNRRVVLAARPRGEPAPGDLRLEEAPVPEPGEGQVLLRTVFLSLDPYMCLRMDEGPSYTPPVGIGEAMAGATVAEVVASRHPGFREGELVLARAGGWQDYAKQSGGTDFARNLAASVRDNPLPLLLIGTGIGWLMLSDRRGGTGGTAGDRHQGALPPPSGRSQPTSVRVYPTGSQTSTSDADDGPSATERASAAVSDAKDRIDEAASGLRDSVAGAVAVAVAVAVDRVGEAASSVYRSAAHAAGSATEGIGAGASSAAQRAADAGRGARDQFGQLGDSTRQGLGWLVREQPLVLGAIGLAVGAAVGALLPGTEAEDRLMGETRDDLAERARATAEEGFERAKETAGEHLEGAQDRLDRSGLSVDRAGDALTDTARGVREAVGDVARGVAEQAKTALGSGNEAVGPSAGQAAPPRQGDASAANPDPSPTTRPGPV